MSQFHKKYVQRLESSPKMHLTNFENRGSTTILSKLSEVHPRNIHTKF